MSLYHSAHRFTYDQLDLGTDNDMRANVTINDLGIVLVSSNAAPSTGGAVAVRVNQ